MNIIKKLQLKLKSEKEEKWIFELRNENSVYYRKENERQHKDSWFIINHLSDRNCKTLQQLRHAVDFAIETYNVSSDFYKWR